MRVPGLLHLEIVQERLEREFGQFIIMTAPSVKYRFILKNGEERMIENPQYYPDPSEIQKAEEPYVRTNIIIPERYMGAVMKLCVDRRGVNSRFNYPTTGRIEINFDLPLAEVVYDFYDRLKPLPRVTGPLIMSSSITGKAPL